MKLPRRNFLHLAASAAALGSSLSAVGTTIVALSSGSALAAVTGADSKGRKIKFHDGVVVPALGQGSWRLGEGRRPEAVEEEALRTGISLGRTLIDTAEIYGNGKSEELIGRVIAGQRDRVFLVSKVWPTHVVGDGVARACEASLARLGTDYLDLYLLHWPSWPPGGLIDLSVAVTSFESLRAAGKIRAWGVSNFDVSEMEMLFQVPNGDHCATNQVLYNVDSRGIEYDLLPWCEKRGMPVMAYSPLGGNKLLHDPTLAKIGAAHGCSAAAVALAWDSPLHCSPPWSDVALPFVAFTSAWNFAALDRKNTRRDIMGSLIERTSSHSFQIFFLLVVQLLERFCLRLASSDDFADFACPGAPLKFSGV